MSATEIINDIRTKICQQIRLVSEGNDRFRILTPFEFGDGDRLSAVLKRSDDGRMILTDEGNTFMRLSYRLDADNISSGTRGKIIDSALSSFGLEDREGELVCPINNCSYGDALFSYIQAILRITDVEYWTHHAVKKTFMDDLKKVVFGALPPNRVELDWCDPTYDPMGTYPVDFRIERPSDTPLFVFGINNEAKCSVATIVIQHFRAADVPFRSLAVFENQEEIQRKQLARLTDVVDKQYSSLKANRESLEHYLASGIAV